MRNQNRVLASEASFAITNALNSCDMESLFEFWIHYKDDLVQSIARYFTNHLVKDLGDQRILGELILATESIFEMQDKCEVE